MECDSSRGKRCHSPSTPSVSKRRKTTEREQSHDSQDPTAADITPSLDEYTLAWICALDVEMAAARAMLDVVHRSPPMPINDSNAYVLGSIGYHNIAVACLPMGQYGLINAAHVLASMQYTFPKLRAVFMVGVGGGAPRADVRLGDVVVGSRVMQIDLGKCVANGAFHRTAVARLLHPWLAKLVNALSCYHQLHRPEFWSIIERMAEKHPYLSRPSDSDDLFESSHLHQNDRLDCLGCDRSKLVPRPGRKSNDPKVHYGAIASANHVMRDSIQRDELAKKHEVICFEMEAAGLGDALPFLSIRGICDYADSHKNKRWQPYAAMAAAAYARELIGTLPDIQDNSTTTGSRGMHVHTARQSTQDQTALNEQREKVMNSLHFEQIDTRRVTIRTAQAKTCGWFLDLPQYTEWLDFKRQSQHHGFLWIRGKPGAGKSTLMKFLCSKTKDKAGRGNSLTISFFFNARGHELEKTTAGMYRSILFQLLHRFPDLQSVLGNADLIPIGIRNRDQCPCVNSMRELLSSAILALGNRSLTCFIDALDECNELSIMEIVRSFEDLALLASEKNIRLRICFASRHYPYIHTKLGTQIILEDQPGHTRDLSKYIKSRLPLTVFEEHKEQLLTKAAGVFLWIVLVVDILQQEYTAGAFAMKTKILELPEGLSELFRNIVRRDEENMESLRLCILWILFARRPLSPEEYHHALWSGLSLANLADPDIPKTTDETAKTSVTSSSKGLAEITKGSHPSVQFIHESVRDFLLKDGGLYELWPEFGLHGESLSHDKLKQCCEIYMTRGLKCQLSEGIPNNQTQLSQRLPLLEYAGKYVLFHADTAVAADGVAQDDFLTQFNLLEWIQVHNLFEKHEIRKYSPKASLFYVLADKGFPHLIRARLKTDPIVHVTGERFRYPFFAALANGEKDAFAALLGLDSYIFDGNDMVKGMKCMKDLKAFKTYTPLTWAAGGGRLKVVELLLKTEGMDLYGQDPKGRFPLFEALEQGQLQVVHFLIEQGARVNTSTKSWTRALEVCAKKGLESAVRFCIAEGANVNGSDYIPLKEASSAGHESVVRYLLDNGADINMVGLDASALSAASLKGHEDIVMLLIERGAEINPDVKRYDYSPLIYASMGGHEAIVRLLLDNGADISAVHKMRSAISAASESGHKEVVRFLIERGAAVDSTMSIEPPLQCASMSGYKAIVRLLLDHGADINRSWRGRSAISKASLFGQEEVVRILIERGAAVDPTTSMEPPLICACKWGYIGIVRLLLDHGVDINRSWKGRSALYKTAVAGKEDVFRLLIERGAPIDGTTCTEAPLIRAARCSNKETIKLLLNNGADINAVHDGQSPLSAATLSGRQNIVTFLIDSGAKITTCTLTYAVRGGWDLIVQLLLQNGAKVNASCHNGRIPIVEGVKWGRRGLIKQLLECGADVNRIYPKTGNTAILQAVQSEFCSSSGEVMSLLVQAGADLNIENHDGDTALLLASRRCRSDIVQVLIDNGANLYHKNKSGDDAFSIAETRGDQELLKMLANKKASLINVPNE